MLQAWVDGRLVDADQATVSVFDRGFRTGEGVFETFRVYGDHIFRLDAHLARAFEGARVIGFDVGEAAEVRRACISTATANAEVIDGDSVLRLTLTPGAIDPHVPFPGTLRSGPTIVVTSQPLALPDDLHQVGIAAATVEGGRSLPQVKALSYLTATVARQRARERGAQEALLVNPATDEVLEGAASNIFAVIGGEVVTPPVSAGLLAGVTRSVTLEVARRLALPVRERALPRELLLSAREAFITATTRELVPVVAIDGRSIGDGAPGPTTRELLNGYREEVARERREQPQRPD